MQVKSRFGLYLVLSLFGVAILGAIALYSLDAALQLQKQKVIVTLLMQSQGVLDHYHELETTGALSRADAQQQAAQALEIMQKGDIYYFARDTGSHLLVHPDRSRIGKVDDGGQNPDKAGQSIVQAYDQALLGTQYAFNQAMANHVGTVKRVPKLNGVFRYQPWGWVVGTGVFVDDVDNTLWHDVIWLSGIAMVLLATLLGDWSSRKKGAGTQNRNEVSAAMRTNLANTIRAMVADNQWTAQQAGSLCRQSAVRMNDLLQGRLSRFSLETLVNIASTLGQHAQPQRRVAMSTEEIR